MRATFKTSIRNRAYLAPLTISVVLVAILLLIGALNIRVSELQVPVRYSSFGITNFYREQWFYQLTFMVFGLVVFAAHALIGLKLYQKKGARFAALFQWLTVTVLVITLVTVAAIFRVAELV